MQVSNTNGKGDSKTVDGDTSTCSEISGPNPWLQINLQGNVTVNEVRFLK